ncbi:ADP-ribosylglycohydrolase family protein [Leucobacter sp. wl10]|uniref:ADP-ribosylglycohydrolase family protein n=1 Tax=Leucobacter sp. wl10 TaxID=2304677 RepID=UPI000E5B7079|nr:ADP-ribosylglycohydrolase family protein [Leucobacter sp. wl10]RGE17617.1 ADP-ribosylglycohydrolase family protein [Leucobacter sp. wl10]
MTAPPRSEHSPLVDRAVGVLLGLAVGDALGMPTQSMSRERIADTYGSITGLVDAVDAQPIAPSMPAGSITDDTEQALLVGELLVSGGGRIAAGTFADALASWERGMEAKGSRDLLGPSTKAAIAAIQQGASLDDDPGRFGTTNGAAMRIAPIGIAFRPDQDILLPAVVEASWITHNTGLGLSAAAAVAAAISVALEDPATGIPELTAAASQAADALTGTGNWVAGASVGARIRWASAAAADLGEAEAVEFIAEIVGTSVASQESVPAAFALIARFGADPYRTLLHAANIGGDTDTIAAIAGAVLGARHGTTAWPKAVTAQVLERNDLDLHPLATALLALRTPTSASNTRVQA